MRFGPLLHTLSDAEIVAIQGYLRGEAGGR
jgi:hypothetical protein